MDMEQTSLSDAPEELNTTPPRIPGDHRPITYKIKTA
jgi:hypothetical protein